MAEVAMLLLLIVAFYACGLYALMNWASPKGKRPYKCYECGRPMDRLQHPGRDLPEEIRRYLNKYRLPKHVVRIFGCPKGHRQLFIAPPVGDETKSLYVARSR